MQWLLGAAYSATAQMQSLLPPRNTSTRDNKPSICNHMTASADSEHSLTCKTYWSGRRLPWLTMLATCTETRPDTSDPPKSIALHMYDAHKISGCRGLIACLGIFCGTAGTREGTFGELWHEVAGNM